MLDAERTFIMDPTPLVGSRLKLEIRVVNQLEREKAQHAWFFTKQRVFEHGEKAGKLLAYLVHVEDRPPVVITLHLPSDEHVSEPRLVARQFREFFQHLYTSTAPGDSSGMLAFLDKVEFPQLTADQVAQLKAPLDSDEIAEALARFPRSKAPDLDGLPVEFHAQFSDELVPRLLSLFNHAFDTCTLPT